MSLLPAVRSDSAHVLVVGAGQMGGGMAKRLGNLGWTVSVVDLQDAVMADFDQNRHSVLGFIEFVATVSIVIVAVVDAAQARQALFGEPHEGSESHHGFARHLRPATSVWLTSTTAPEDAASIGNSLEGLGLYAVDAPVSGGPTRAVDGSMSWMLSGPLSVIDSHRALTAALSQHVHVLSEHLGLASKAKLINNALATVNLYNHAQALAAGGQLGLNPAGLNALVAQSSGNSWIGAERAARWLVRDQTVKARMALLAKDSALALAMLRNNGHNTAWLEPAASAFAQACAAGWCDRDDSALLAWVAAAAPNLSR